MPSKLAPLGYIKFRASVLKICFLEALACYVWLHSDSFFDFVLLLYCAGSLSLFWPKKSRPFYWLILNHWKTQKSVHKSLKLPSSASKFDNETIQMPFITLGTSIICNLGLFQSSNTALRHSNFRSEKEREFPGIASV